MPPNKIFDDIGIMFTQRLDIIDSAGKLRFPVDKQDIYFLCNWRASGGQM
jgi:hypothetical protein